MQPPVDALQEFKVQTRTYSSELGKAAGAVVNASVKSGSFQNTDRREPPVLDDPVASGDFASNILIRGQNMVAGWSRVFGSSLFSEFRFGYNRVRSDSVHPAFGIDSNAEFGIRGVPNDPRV